ncbi:hypothetical protein F5Y16DRAFT_106153 [Xylariaceae sp. FL0255]|nr:hypothetical protein F5Y16DRAFT_106153 [Xylariaceae sp. FL0255]
MLLAFVVVATELALSYGWRPNEYSLLEAHLLTNKKQTSIPRRKKGMGAEKQEIQRREPSGQDLSMNPRTKIAPTDRPPTDLPV